MSQEIGSVGRVIRDDQTQEKYFLLKRLGRSAVSFTSVYKAEQFPKELPPSSSRTATFRTNFVAMKMVSNDLDGELLFEEHGRSYDDQVHNNVIGVKKLFTSDELVCVSMPYMDEGSLRYIISTRFKNGIPEDCIAIALREALLGLSFIHSRNEVHKYFSAANIFVMGNPTSIGLAFEASMYKHDPDPYDDDITEKFNAKEASTSALHMEDICFWAAAPEVYESDKDSKPYESAADIWLVGITALELAYGCLPVATRQDLNAVIKKFRKKQNLPRLGKLMEPAKKVKVNKGKKMMQLLNKKVKALTVQREKEVEERQFSKDFEEMVVKCLAKRPTNRPTADELLQSPFFINCKDMQYFRQTLLHAKQNKSDD